MAILIKKAQQGIPLDPTDYFNNSPGYAVKKMTFGETFAAARKAGMKEFDYKGKKYGTQMADEAIAENKPQWSYADRPGYVGAPTTTAPAGLYNSKTKPIQLGEVTVVGEKSKPATAPQKYAGKYIPEPEPQKLPYPEDRSKRQVIPTGPDFPVITDITKKKLGPYIPEPEPQKLPYPIDKGIVTEEPKKIKQPYVPEKEPQKLPYPIDTSGNRSTAPASGLPKDVLDRIDINRKNKNYETFGGKYFVMSKDDSHIYAFNNKHELIDSTAAGRGKSVGDKINRADPDSNIAGPHSYTRAGSAVLTESKGRLERAEDIDTYGAPAYRIKYNDVWKDSENLVLHGIYKSEKEFREAVLDDPTKIDKLISWGCINVKPEWLVDSKTKPNTGDSLYITQEPKRNLPKGLLK